MPLRQIKKSHLNNPGEDRKRSKSESKKIDLVKEEDGKKRNKKKKQRAKERKKRPPSLLLGIM